MDTDPVVGGWRGFAEVKGFEPLRLPRETQRISSAPQSSALAHLQASPLGLTVLMIARGVAFLKMPPRRSRCAHLRRNAYTPIRRQAKTPMWR